MIEHLNTFIPILIALQFAAVGWRINREISVGDQSRKTWLPIPDILNILSFFFVILFSILLPISGYYNKSALKIVIGTAYVLLAFYPINIAGHYCLFSMKGRLIYEEKKKDIPYTTGQEWITLAITLIVAIVLAYAIYNEG